MFISGLSLWLSDKTDKTQLPFTIIVMNLKALYLRSYPHLAIGRIRLLKISTCIVKLKDKHPFHLIGLFYHLRGMTVLPWYLIPSCLARTFP
jgi:hypothetical protein